jgi:hypothetical protein
VDSTAARAVAGHPSVVEAMNKNMARLRRHVEERYREAW